MIVEVLLEELLGEFVVALDSTLFVLVTVVLLGLRELIHQLLELVLLLALVVLSLVQVVLDLLQILRTRRDIDRYCVINDIEEIDVRVNISFR